MSRSIACSPSSSSSSSSSPSSSPSPRRFVAHELWQMLAGKPITALLAIMDLEVSSGRVDGPEIRELPGPPRQSMLTWLYDDGTLVRYRPLGDELLRAPTFSIEIKADCTRDDLTLDNIAFKVATSGAAVPKRTTDMANPYSPVTNPIQFQAFRDTILMASRFGVR